MSKKKKYSELIANFDENVDATETEAHKQALSKLKIEINNIYEQIDKTSLGLEHFFREIGRIYELSILHNNSMNSDLPFNPATYLQLPEPYADLIIEGMTIEILDGDIGVISNGWLDAVLHGVCKNMKNRNVFVLSILGLQSTGKSTLLNAIFGCKFNVSMGRCTRGLFMRYMKLSDKLQKLLGIEGILIIDTEGLGAPEKMNEPDAQEKDRLMATFAMAVSNLTLINVSGGDSKREIVNILEIVILTMSRLEKSNQSPDILLVQHVSEKNAARLAKGIDEFCNALKEAINLVSLQ